MLHANEWEYARLPLVNVATVFNYLYESAQIICTTLLLSRVFLFQRSRNTEHLKRELNFSVGRIFWTQNK